MPRVAAAITAGLLLYAAVHGAPSATGATTGAGSPSLRWQITERVGGTRGGPAGIGFSRARVVLAGTAGGDPRGDDTDAVIHAYRRGDGRTLWSRRFDTGVTEKITALVTTPRQVFAVGNATSIDVGQFHSNSFVLALRARDGVSRWENVSDLEPGNFGESIYDAAISDDLLILAGTIESKILVRAVRQRTGEMVWEDTSAPDFGIDERVQKVLVRGNRVYVAGDRHTVGGRSAPYVVRAYALASGELLWERLFGQQVNSVRGLQWMDGSLAVAGHYWDIGPGTTQMEVWALAPGEGDVLWVRRPAGRGAGSSSTGDLASMSGMAFVGGAASRARQLPVIRAYNGDGTSPWNSEAGDLRAGTVNGVATHGSTVLAAGAAEDRGASGRRYWLRGHDAATGTQLWEEFVQFGRGDSAAVTLASSGSWLAVAGTGSAANGEQLWVLRLYRSR